MDPAVRELVRTRASNACEYCRIPQEATPVIPFHVEHIVSRQHGGTDDPATLALACDRCNAYTRIKDRTSQVSIPTAASWLHCSIRGRTSGQIISSSGTGHIVGLTSTGR